MQISVMIRDQLAKVEGCVDIHSNITLRKLFVQRKQYNYDQSIVSLFVCFNFQFGTLPKCAVKYAIC